MKKKLMTMIISAAVSLSMCIPAFAGQWLSNANGWFWQNDDGTYPANEWVWIDGDGDNISECYYFDENGYCLVNTMTPDGYMVNNSGAWTVDGDIQRQPAVPQPTPNPAIKNPEELPANEVLDWQPPEVPSGAPAVRLRDLKPVDSANYNSTWNNRKLDYNDIIWSEPVILGGSGYVEFATDGLYNQLSFTLGFEKTVIKADTATLRIYGDNDQILWEYTTEAGYGEEHKPKEYSVNITGQKRVMIQYLDTSSRSNALFNNAEFK